jgi:hypothetical protein
MPDSLKFISLKKHFSEKEYITTSEIRSFYQKSEPVITDSTLYWRIYNLVKTGELKRIGRGVFSFTNLIEFSHDLNKEDITIFKKLHKNFPFTSICIWNTSIFNHFMNHQLFKYYTLVEVERIAMESVFHFISVTKSGVLLNPTDEILYRYSGREPNTIIVIPLVSQAPLMNQNDIITPSLEKILVDVFSDTVIFASEQGSELTLIFSRAFKQFRININRMLRYAMRRGKHDQLVSWMKDNLEFRQLLANIDKI